MKNYNKILEAVNQGIKFALDDFEDQEDIQGQVNSKVNHYKGSWNEVLDSVVDLGLPSGTLWCKYNLDVNPNQLSKPEDWYGGYYYWGGLVNCNGDRRDELVPQKLGKNYFMPTLEQFRELRKYTTNEWIKNYNKISGLNGRLFKSKINGNTLFFPAAGYENGNVQAAGYCGTIMSSTGGHMVWAMGFRPSGIDISERGRGGGRSVHPVYKFK